MNHLALFIGAPGHDGTPIEMVRAALQFFLDRMPTVLVRSRFDHQGRQRSVGQTLEGEFSVHLDEAIVDAATESDHRNCGLAFVRSHRPETDRIWIVDTDEFYFDQDFEELKRTVEVSDQAAWMVRRYAYWKGINWRVEIPEPTPAPFCINPKKVPAFIWGRDFAIDSRRWPTSGVTLTSGIFQHHLTAVRSDAEMEQKWRVFHHAGEQRPGWFEEVWKNWTPEMTSLHPTDPFCWNRAIPVSIDDVPQACRRDFERWSFAP